MKHCLYDGKVTKVDMWTRASQESISSLLWHGDKLKYFKYLALTSFIISLFTLFSTSLFSIYGVCPFSSVYANFQGLKFLFHFVVLMSMHLYQRGAFNDSQLQLLCYTSWIINFLFCRHYNSSVKFHFTSYDWCWKNEYMIFVTCLKR